VGERVLAIGNPFGLEGTVTSGIVSGKGRMIGQGPYDQFLPTDASINPGNSGGPLVNRSGEVVGVNTAIVSATGGSVGVGFAIPINEAKAILPQLQAKGRVTRGWLGVAMQEVTPDLAKALRLPGGQGALVANVMKDSPAAKAGIQAGGSTPSTPPNGGKLGLGLQPLTPELARELGVQARAGVVVTAVKPGGPAAEAGIRPGDVIVQANRKPVRTLDELYAALNAGKSGDPTLLQIQRKDASRFVAVPPRG
jgi:serine protease Do